MIEGSRDERVGTVNSLLSALACVAYVVQACCYLPTGSRLTLPLVVLSHIELVIPNKE